MAKSIQDLISGNKKWTEKILKDNPDFFTTLSNEQKPQFLWIGCSDSRVPASEITGTRPGSIFVQRNIANVVSHTDSNLLSVVYFAVKVLKVKHIIVCGHYGCGGVESAMSNEMFGFLDNWLLHLKDVYRTHQAELDLIDDNKKKLNRFVELNIITQVSNLAKVSFIQEEWAKGQFPYIHGWVYGLSDGLIRDLNVSINSNKDLESIYQYSNEK
ncbi:MAG: carbonate dehydratase [Thiolinea sp.]